MASFVRGRYAGQTVDEVRKKDPEYIQEMYESNMNVIGDTLSEREVEDIREHQLTEQRARDCQ